MPRPRGLPKTGGRQKGTANRATVEDKRTAREIAQAYTPRAMVKLIDLAENGKTEGTCLAAIGMIIDRGHGRIPNVEVEKIPSVTPMEIGQKLNGDGAGNPPIALDSFRRTG